MKVEVHSIGGVKDINWDLTGHHLFLVGGRNENGKTSAIKSLVMALAGRSGMSDYPDVALRDGEDEGVVRVVLSGDGELHDDAGFVAELVLERRRNGTVKETFQLVDSTGDPAPEPRNLLQRLYSTHAFDPTSFDRMSRKEQRAVLQQMFPELDFTSIDNEIAELYDKRRDVNRQGKELKARYDAMPDHDDVPEEPVIVAELMDELRRRRDANQDNARERSKHNELIDTRDGLKAIADKTAADVAWLEAKLVTARKQLAVDKQVLEEMDASIAEHKEVVDKLQDVDTLEVEEQIAGAESINEKIRAKKNKARLGGELATMRKQSQAMTDKMKQLEDKKAKALKSAKFPVDGLGFDSEGVTYNDLPYEQAPQSKRLRIGAAIAMALKPKLRLMVCEHGSDLDWESFEEFDAILKEHDFQAIMELCTRNEADDERCHVVMCNGEVKE